MAIDANIALGYKSPDIMGADERQANAQHLQSGNIANQTNQLALNAAQSKQTQNDQARQIMMNANGDHVKAIQDLTSAGFNDQAQALQKYADERTSAADTHNASSLKLAHDKSDRLGQAYGTVAQAPDEQIHQVAWQTMDSLVQSGDVTPEWAAQAKQDMSKLPPEQLRQQAQTGYQQVLSAKEQLPKPAMQDLGGSVQPITTSPVTGAVTQIGQPLQKTNTPFQTASLQETNRSNMAKEDATDNADVSLGSDAIANAAARYNIDGTLPSLGMGKKSALQKANILNQAALMSAGIDPTDQRVNQLDNKSKSGALLQNSKDIAAITPYKEMLDKNANIAIDLGNKVMMTDSTLANKSLNWLKQNAGDNPDTAEYLAQMVFVQTESARVLNNPRLVGQLSDSARQEMEGVINGNMPINATERVLNRIKQDGNNRVDAMLKQHDVLIQSFKHPSPDATKTSPSSIPMTAANYLKANPQYRTQFDSKYGAGASNQVLGQ